MSIKALHFLSAFFALDLVLKEARDVMSNHLQFCKWKDSAFSAEQFKSTRWLLNARPKQVPDSLKDILTVSPMAQVMLMELHVHSFLQASRRLKVSQRARLRASPDDFEKLTDFACMFASIRQKVKQVSSDPGVDGKLLEAFMAKFLGIPIVSNCFFSNLSIWMFMQFSIFLITTQPN